MTYGDMCLEAVNNNNADDKKRLIKTSMKTIKKGEYVTQGKGRERTRRESNRVSPERKGRDPEDEESAI